MAFKDSPEQLQGGMRWGRDYFIKDIKWYFYTTVILQLSAGILSTGVLVIRLSWAMSAALFRKRKIKDFILTFPIQN